jgi:hypothetical protein
MIEHTAAAAPVMVAVMAAAKPAMDAAMTEMFGHMVKETTMKHR